MTSAEPKAHIHDHSLSWLGLGTSVTYRYDSVKLVLWAQTSPFSEIMPVYKNKTNGKVQSCSQSYLLKRKENAAVAVIVW